MGLPKYKFKHTRDNIAFVRKLAKGAPVGILRGQLDHSAKEYRKRSQPEGYREYHKMVVDEVKSELKRRGGKG